MRIGTDQYLSVEKDRSVAQVGVQCVERDSSVVQVGVQCENRTKDSYVIVRYVYS